MYYDAARDVRAEIGEYALNRVEVRCASLNEVRDACRAPPCAARCARRDGAAGAGGATELVLDADDNVE